jgi:stage III sporulation protein AD
MKIISIAAICIISTVLCKLFENRSKEYGLFIRVIVSAGIIAAVIIYVSPIAETVNSIFIKTGADEKYVNILFKALGICYLTQFTHDICKDSGENAMATQVEIAGKITLMLIALPLFSSLTDVITKLMGS